MTIAGTPWILAGGVLLAATITRAYLMLGPAEGSGSGIPLYFVVLALLPLLVCTREGRRRIGVHLPTRYAWLVWGALAGAALALLTGAIGFALYGRSPDNWFMTVRGVLYRQPELASLPPAALLPALAIPAAIFSPLGEELFFRGFLFESIAERFGAAVATWSTAVSFGLIHLLHHGVVLRGGLVEVRPVSGAIWVLLTMAVSLLLTFCRRRSGGSIWAAVAAHSAFNVAMIAIIVRLTPP